MDANNTPTIFTDKDLKDLKSSIEFEKTIYPNASPTDKHLSLITRLEAAERCAGYLGSLAVLDTTMEVLLKEWREVSGKV